MVNICKGLSQSRYKWSNTNDLDWAIYSNKSNNELEIEILSEDEWEHNTMLKESIENNSVNNNDSENKINKVTNTYKSTKVIVSKIRKLFKILRKYNMLNLMIVSQNKTF